jgi:hypothetical protein
MGVRPHIGGGLSDISYSVSDPSFYKAYFDTFLAGNIFNRINLTSYLFFN